MASAGGRATDLGDLAADPIRLLFCKEGEFVKRIKIYLEWVFAPHGYLNWYDEVPVFGQRLSEIMKFMAYCRKKKIHTNKCKMCGRAFQATKKHPTCQAISCYVDYRMNGHKRKGK